MESKPGIVWICVILLTFIATGCMPSSSPSKSVQPPAGTKSQDIMQEWTEQQTKYTPVLDKYPPGPIPVPTLPVSPVPKPTPKPKGERHETNKPSLPVQKQSDKAGKRSGKQSAQQKKLSLGELRRKYAETFILSGPSRQKNIALTFDDGPDRHFTVQVLDILKKYRVHATFYLVGNKAKANPDIVKRIVKEGHTVGNHSYSHPLLTKMSLRQFQQQVESAEQILLNLTGYLPKCFRPPYGAINEEQLVWAASKNYLVTNWDIDSLDWKGLSSEQVLTNIWSHRHPGAIVLQHCGAGNANHDLSGSVKALPQLIEKLAAEGYQFVTVPELLNIPSSR
ncbi:polysaccharide deacetylase family protein [Paenibacillus larvae]